MAALPNSQMPPLSSQRHSCGLEHHSHVQPSDPEGDTSTVGDDASDISSTSSVLDTNSLGWSYFRITNAETTDVYEAWEMLLVNPSRELHSKTRVLGMDVKNTYVIAKDGYTGVRAVPYYQQDELARMVASAQQAHDASPSTALWPWIRKRRSYAQDLSERLFALPGSLANKLGALLDTRQSATNKSPYTRREWKVVFMKPIENPIAGEVTRNNIRSPRISTHNSHSKKVNPVQKWLLIVRGQVTQTSEDGFAAFDTASNPWLRVDERLHREKRHSRIKGASD